MHLSAWINTFSPNQRRAERERIAKLLAVSEVTIRSYANQNRSVPAEQLIPLKKATYGKVSPEEMRPDLADLYCCEGDGRTDPSPNRRTTPDRRTAERRQEPTRRAEEATPGRRTGGERRQGERRTAQEQAPDKKPKESDRAA